MKKELKKTNYVIVMDYSKESYLEEAYLLGWNNNEDWFDTGIDSRDIMTPAGNVKKNHWGLIDVDSHSSAYVGETFEDCASYADDARKEGYECTVCRLEKDDVGAIRIIPVED